MTRTSKGLKVAMAIISAALFLTFSRLSFSLLVPGAIGIALVIFGIVLEYRPAAVLGLFVSLSVAALSIEIVTMADVSTWQTTMLGLFAPTSLLAWSAFLSERSDSYEIRLRTRPFVTALVIGAVFAVALPATIALTNIMYPVAGNSMSTMAEISLLFVIIAVTALISIWSKEESPSGETHS
ncbi:MAG: hypothetical protein JSV94_06150 [Methanobacteriota archaeon]|nr:MAG: hypothetical protein JSV94_06150 [Euryarchaeota archaeon]